MKPHYDTASVRIDRDILADLAAHARAMRRTIRAQLEIAVVDYFADHPIPRKGKANGTRTKKSLRSLSRA